MTSKNTSNPVGVIGAGSFGKAVAYLLSKNNTVILYARNKVVVDEINSKGIKEGSATTFPIKATNDLQMLAKSCKIIFPVVPSGNFRLMMKDLAKYLHPYHIIIHGTKGLEVSVDGHSSKELNELKDIQRSDILTMSEVILEESVSVRVGCLSGPNLAAEIMEDHPAATVLASNFDEVIEIGQTLLRSDRFQVYGNKDLTGIELAGVLKNIIAIASGSLSGLGYGENARSLLISRGMVEMIYLGKTLGGNTQAFIGLAGIGDLIATCTSPLSRNYSVGYRLAKGETIQEIIDSMDEVAEGVRTVQIVKSILDQSTGRAPITEAVYKVLFEGMTIKKALDLLMRAPFNVDIDFM